MKIVRYKKSLHSVGTMRCPKCKKKTYAWRSSGMSMCFPHFYCNKCSNVIHRFCDQKLVYDESTQEKLDQIADSLPNCPCGGKFVPGANPKCGHCGSELPHQNNPLQRLDDPHMIVTNGACVFSDNKETYKVEID